MKYSIRTHALYVVQVFWFYAWKWSWSLRLRRLHRLTIGPLNDARDLYVESWREDMDRLEAAS